MKLMEINAEPRPVTRKEMADAQVPLAYRDNCAHLLIPLNRCRFEQYYLPWRCEVTALDFHDNEALGML